MKNPCHECKKRSPSCHGSCEAYAEMVAQYEAVRQERAKSADMRGYAFQQNSKRRSRKLKDRMRGRDV